MAEFQEVARHWKRMCKKYWTATSCHGCPIAEYEQGYEACSAYEADVAKIEELVMSWVAEHPEPVYPTWGEWFVSKGMLPEKWDNLTSAYMNVGCVPNLIHSPIPADLAEKLGIEPKEG